MDAFNNTIYHCCNKHCFVTPASTFWQKQHVYAIDIKLIMYCNRSWGLLYINMQAKSDYRLSTQLLNSRRARHHWLTSSSTPRKHLATISPFNNLFLRNTRQYFFLCDQCYTEQQARHVLCSWYYMSTLLLTARIEQNAWHKTAK